MQSINEVLKHQQDYSSINLENSNKFEHISLIKFDICNRKYAIDINNVVEVVENLIITSLPENNEGYLGIVNIRGRVIPILNFLNTCNKNNNKNLNKFLILQFNDGEHFGILCEKVIKIVCKEEILKSGQIININETPVKYISTEDFAILKGKV